MKKDSSCFMIAFAQNQNKSSRVLRKKNVSDDADIVRSFREAFLNEGRLLQRSAIARNGSDRRAIRKVAGELVVLEGLHGAGRHAHARDVGRDSRVTDLDGGGGAIDVDANSRMGRNVRVIDHHRHGRAHRGQLDAGRAAGDGRIADVDIEIAARIAVTDDAIDVPFGYDTINDGIEPGCRGDMDGINSAIGDIAVRDEDL
jgi:hypothetical protein